jgi:fatty-acyl-CoA synthase
MGQAAGPRERAAAPKRVDVVDAIPLTAVGKPYKPELRRRAAETVAREALGTTAVAVGVLVDGAVEIHITNAAEEDTARAAMDAYAWTWRFTS